MEIALTSRAGCHPANHFPHAPHATLAFPTTTERVEQGTSDADVVLILERSLRIIECQLVEILVKLGEENPGVAADRGAAQADVGDFPEERADETAPVAPCQNRRSRERLASPPASSSRSHCRMPRKRAPKASGNGGRQSVLREFLDVKSLPDKPSACQYRTPLARLPRGHGLGGGILSASSTKIVTPPPI